MIRSRDIKSQFLYPAGEVRFPVVYREGHFPSGIDLDTRLKPLFPLAAEMEETYPLILEAVIYFSALNAENIE